MPELRGAFDDRADDEHGHAHVQPLRRIDARRGMTRRVAPSILAADFGRLREQVRDIIDAGASVIHVDVMDGHFVPPITMGPNAVEALRDLGADLDVHLMIERPERQVADFAKAGAGTIIIHAEATPHIDYTLEHIRAAGCRAGLAVNPSTPLAVYAESDVDQALCMTVNPGWGGQEFIGRSLDKIRRLRSLLGDGRDLEVDGGIDAQTAGPCADAGASLLVAGTAIFGAPDPAAAFAQLASKIGCS
jgi:ribulose-phosphate 3-epimerase